MYTRPLDDELFHYGVKGMKWGVRHDYKPKGRKRSRKRQDDKSDKKSKKTEKKKFQLSDRQKKILVAGAVVAGTALAIYGGHKLYKLHVNKKAAAKAAELAKKYKRKPIERTT